VSTPMGNAWSTTTACYWSAISGSVAATASARRR
jgi:hypothetical protein